MNNQTTGANFICEPLILQTLFGVIGAVLLLSLCWNILFCVSKCHSGKAICQPRKRQQRSSRQMEDNPIYGNISYMQTSITLITDGDAAPSGSQPRGNSDSQSKTQDCYANLTLQAPRVQSGRSSPQIQYSDIVQAEEPPQSEREDEACADGASTMSDLYASVQTQRIKTIDPAVDGEGYANHL